MGGHLQQKQPCEEGILCLRSVLGLVSCPPTSHGTVGTTIILFFHHPSVLLWMSLFTSINHNTKEQSEVESESLVVS